MTDNTTNILTVVEIPISAINKDRRTQLRIDTDGDQVENLQAAITDGDILPPVDVFAVGDGTFWIADGWHRYIAAVGLKLDTIQAVVHAGGFKEALQFALGANATHGLRRSNKDKRHAVEVAVKEFATLSNRAIADLCHVHHSLVDDVRPQLADSANSRTGKDGKKYHSKGPKTAQQLDFFARLDEDFAPIVKTFDAILKQPYWLQEDVKSEEKLEGIEAMRARIRDLDGQLATRAAAIKKAAPSNTATPSDFLN